MSGCYQVGAGTQISVRDFTQRAFEETGVTLKWEGEGAEEHGVCSKSGAVLVKIDPRYFRPAEVDTLVGDSSKALSKLGWKATTPWQELCAEMVSADLRDAQRESLLEISGL